MTTQFDGSGNAAQPARNPVGGLKYAKLPSFRVDAPSPVFTISCRHCNASPGESCTRDSYGYISEPITTVVASGHAGRRFEQLVADDE